MVEQGTDAVEAGKVPHKPLVEITDPRLMSRILYCNPVRERWRATATATETETETQIETETETETETL